MVSLADHTMTSSSGMPLPPSRASRGQSNMLCFSEFPDRLACDPMNCTWVYGMYAFKFDSTEAQAHAHIEALVGHLMARAARHYAQAVIAFRRLSPSERSAHVMHGVLPVSKPVEMPFLFLPRHASPQMNTAAAASSSARRASMSLASGGAPVSPRGSLSVSSGQPMPGSGRRRGSLSTARATRAAHSLSESEAMQLLLKRWPALPQSPEEQVRLWLRQQDAHRGGIGEIQMDSAPIQSGETTTMAQGRAGHLDQTSPEVSTTTTTTTTASALGMSLRVRLVIDIIASRKSLGATEDITESTPYRLGQHVYEYVQRSFSHTTSAATFEQNKEKGRGSGGSVGNAKNRPHASPMNHSTTGATLSPRDVSDWLSEDVDAVAGAVFRHMVVAVTTVAISDAANKLAGRDVLFPCRGSVSSSGGSGAASAIAGYHGSQGDATTTAAAIDHLLSASPAMMLMFPSNGACLPPVQKELLDQNRMVICFPRMASVTK